MDKYFYIYLNAVFISFKVIFLLVEISSGLYSMSIYFFSLLIHFFPDIKYICIHLLYWCRVNHVQALLIFLFIYFWCSVTWISFYLFDAEFIALYICLSIVKFIYFRSIICEALSTDTILWYPATFLARFSVTLLLYVLNAFAPKQWKRGIARKL